MPRPRKCLEDHVRDGTYRADRHGPLPSHLAKGGGPSVAPDVVGSERNPPVKPADLTGPAATIWANLLKLLGPVVNERDGPMLAELCWHWAELRRVKDVIAKTKPGEKGYNQLLIASGICTDKLDKIAGRFGLTPADRAKLKVEASGPPVAKVPTRPKTKLDQQGPPPAPVPRE